MKSKGSVPVTVAANNMSGRAKVNLRVLFEHKSGGLLTHLVAAKLGINQTALSSIEIDEGVESVRFLWTETVQGKPLRQGIKLTSPSAWTAAFVAWNQESADDGQAYCLVSAGLGMHGVK